MAQKSTRPARHALSLLSLDGGGIRGLSELLILHEIMCRIKSKRGLTELPRPCDYFDLIGGSGTGGLIALLLGRLRMTTDEALRTYKSLTGAIFSDANKKWIFKNGVFKATTLERKVQELTSERFMRDTSTQSEDKGKAFVCTAANTDHDPVLHQNFRTYPQDDYYTPDCFPWEAARATTAVPTIFKPVTICSKKRCCDEKPYCFHTAKYCAGVSNPVNQVLNEAGDVFWERAAVGCLVSVGAGHPEMIGLAKPDAFQHTLPTSVIQTLKKIAADCERTASDLNWRLKGCRHPDFYFRFNVVYGAEGISLQEWENIEDPIQHMKAYMADAIVSKAVDEVVSRLCIPRDACLTLKDIYLQVR